MGPTDKLTAAVTERDGPVYADDAVEIFFQPDIAQKNYYQFIVNSEGVVFDTKGMDGAVWNGPWKVATSVAADSWTGEASIPLKALGLAAKDLQAGKVMGINVVRDQKNPAVRISTWSPSSIT
ncbi:MAG: carbohydrate-binding family 9-like protein, partial [Terrimicrobiaceae bacterium]